MKYNFDTEKEYAAPVCKVYSVMVESVIAASIIDDEGANDQGDDF